MTTVIAFSILGLFMGATIDVIYLNFKKWGLKRELRKAAEESSRLEAENLKLQDIKKRHDELKYRLESYPERLEEVLIALEPMRTKAREGFNGIGEAMERRDEGDILTCHLRTSSALEQIEALFKEAQKVKEAWNEDLEAYEELEKEIDKMMEDAGM